MAENEGAKVAPTSLKSIFDGVDTPSEESSSKETPPENKEEKPAASEEKKSDEKKEDPPASPEKQKIPVAEKKEEQKPPVEKKDSPKEEKKEEKKEDPPSEKKDESKTPWDSEDNPYVKRYQDTAKWGNEQNQKALQLAQQNQQQAREIEKLNKKLNGTWTEDDEKAEQVSPEQIAASSLSIGKSVASRNAAYQLLGKEKVDAQIAEFNDLFEGNPIVQQIVLNDEAPVFRALDILDRYRFEKHYGDNPKAQWEAIRKEHRAEIEKELREQISKELLEASDKKKKNAAGRIPSGSGDNGTANNKGAEGFKPTPLKTIFS